MVETSRGGEKNTVLVLDILEKIIALVNWLYFLFIVAAVVEVYSYPIVVQRFSVLKPVAVNSYLNHFEVLRSTVCLY